ncbi:MAG: hypothetical protein K2Q33_01545 [Gammaproteobacteria bacterium]|nr:hypothetical protein [Gammaproteobacteria bacterium]
MPSKLLANLIFSKKTLPSKGLRVFLAFIVALIGTAHQSCLCHNLQAVQAPQAPIAVAIRTHSCCQTVSGTQAKSAPTSKIESTKVQSESAITTPGGMCSAHAGASSRLAPETTQSALQASHQCCRTNAQPVSLAPAFNNDNFNSNHFKVSLLSLPALSQSTVESKGFSTNKLFARFGLIKNEWAGGSKTYLMKRVLLI